MSKATKPHTGWPWQVTTALWLYLADIPAMILAALAVQAKMTGAANVIDPQAPGDGYFTAANILLSMAFMGLVVFVCLAELVLLGVVWKFQRGMRHVLAACSAVFLLLLLGVGVQPGLAAYAAFMGVATMLATGLIYSKPAEIWFERQPVDDALDVTSPPEPQMPSVSTTLPYSPQPQHRPPQSRPLNIILATACLAGLVALMFVDWSLDMSGFSRVQIDVTITLNGLIALALLAIPYGVWRGALWARKIAIPFCAVCTAFLLPYVLWDPDMITRAMLLLAVGSLVLLNWRGTKIWFKAK